LNAIKRMYVPSKPITLDLMYSLDFLPMMKGLILLSKRILQKEWRKWKNVERFLSANSVLFIFEAQFTQRSYRACKKRSRVSARFEVRGFYGICRDRSAGHCDVSLKSEISSSLYCTPGPSMSILETDESAYRGQQRKSSEPQGLEDVSSHRHLECRLSSLPNRQLADQSSTRASNSRSRSAEPCVRFRVRVYSYLEWI
jgi:hypothetical protein